ncbi:MAG TPA: sensor domain-containing protein [Ktedonobacteraceae bacterium]|nr:sensor domain-containing protein [Ktedonobacteraceae bacterium]
MATLFNALGRKQTWLNISYLLLSFPLGTFYFVFLVTMLSLGLSTVIVWVGLPILVLTYFAMRGLAALERELARHMLHVEIADARKYAARTKFSWVQWVKNGLSSPTTWKSLAYLFIKFPLGIFSFCVALTLLVSSFTMTLEPVAYLINANILAIINAHGHEAHSWLPFFVYTDGTFDMGMFVRSFLGVPAGIMLTLGSLYFLNWLAWLSGQLARVMLSTGSQEKASPKDESNFGYAYQPQPQAVMMEQVQRG